METFNIEKVVIWGLEPNSHTHAYIHESFLKAFKHLGYETYWLPDRPSNMDFHGSLFISVNIACAHLPIRNDCLYVLHNCAGGSLYHINKIHNILWLRTYKKRRGFMEKDYITDDPFIFGRGGTLYTHWATDLLPDEIDENIKNFIDYDKRSINGKKVSGWVGSINYCPINGNEDLINEYVMESEKEGFPFYRYGLYIGHPIDTSSAISHIKNSYLAPAIQGEKQVFNSYIPCRIFKNISYGHISGTNNEGVLKLFPNIPYSKNGGELFHLMKKSVEEPDAKDKTIKLMEQVRDKYTYLNLIHHIFTYFDQFRRNEIIPIY